MSNRLMEATTLHELLQIAIEDFELQLKNPNFKVSMGDWLVHYDNDPADKCTGCLAGACLLQEGIELEFCQMFYHPETYPAGHKILDLSELGNKYPKLLDRIYAIDALRTGGVNDAYCYFHKVKECDKYWDQHVTRFQISADKFVRDLCRLQQYLFETGI